jgi:hypothetical protein
MLWYISDGGARAASSRTFSKLASRMEKRRQSWLLPPGSPTPKGATLVSTLEPSVHDNEKMEWTASLNSPPIQNWWGSFGK